MVNLIFNPVIVVGIPVDKGNGEPKEGSERRKDWGLITVAALSSCGSRTRELLSSALYLYCIKKLTDNFPLPELSHANSFVIH
jgi:hypothetical protein